jgi:hypothetical protein
MATDVGSFASIGARFSNSNGSSGHKKVKFGCLCEALGAVSTVICSTAASAAFVRTAIVCASFIRIKGGKARLQK